MAQIEFLEWFIVSVVPTNDGVQAMRTRCVAADDELLSEVYAMLDPSPTSFARSIDAVAAFPECPSLRMKGTTKVRLIRPAGLMEVRTVNTLFSKARSTDSCEKSQGLQFLHLYP